MEVLYYPPWGDGDYQNFLYSELKNIGVRATEATSHSLFPILANKRKIRRADVFHIHWIHTLYSGGSYRMVFLPIFIIPQMYYLKMIDTPIVWTAHNKTTHDTPHPKLDIAIRSYFARNVCNKIIVHCNSAKTIIHDTYGLKTDEKIEVIPHGNYDAYPRTSQEDAGIDVDTPEGGCCYVHFGSIKPYKGTVGLIEAFSSVAKEDDRLLIVGQKGDGEYVEQVKDAAKGDPRVKTIFRYIKNKEFQSVSEIADVMVLPYIDVLTSGTAHLALSFGIPVVAPRKGCLPETVPEKGGVLYKPGSLKEAMEEAKYLDIDVASASIADEIKTKTWGRSAWKTKRVYRSVR